MTRFILGIWFCLAMSLQLAAETRAAFIVGNSDYQNAPSLENPVNDAKLVAETLTGLGFKVSSHLDLTRREMTSALTEFLKENEEADVTLFYFAGHGMQFEGKNYLIGTDASLKSEFDVESETLELARVVNMIERRSKAALIFIDACRDNPLADQFYRENFSETRALQTRGLAPVKTSSDGAMLVFSAAPGQVAYDGVGENSPFAKSLAKHLPSENIEVLSLMKRIIRDVKVETGDRQVPMVTNDLTTEIYLATTQTGIPKSAPKISISVPREDAKNSFSAGICEVPKSIARRFICNNQELVAREVVHTAHLRRQLTLVKGSARGTALIAERDWRRSQDECGEDVQCHIVAYQRRDDELSAFDGTPATQSDRIMQLQSELNRLSCGAGNVDGDFGPSTRRAIERFNGLKGLNISSNENQISGSIAHLSKQKSHVCSVLSRSYGNPKLIEGTWRATAKCGANTLYPNETRRVSFNVNSQSWSDSFSGSVVGSVRGDGSFTLTRHKTFITITAAWRSAGSTRFTLTPSSQPNQFVGTDSNKCIIEASKL
jgi:peptidoglycan hydrolase-like protein with peptidoglycan-binding domain